MATVAGSSDGSISESGSSPESYIPNYIDTDGDPRFSPFPSDSEMDAVPTEEEILVPSDEDLPLHSNEADPLVANEFDTIISELVASMSPNQYQL